VAQCQDTFFHGSPLLDGIPAWDIVLPTMDTVYGLVLDGGIPPGSRKHMMAAEVETESASAGEIHHGGLAGPGSALRWHLSRVDCPGGQRSGLAVRNAARHDRAGGPWERPAFAPFSHYLFECFQQQHDLMTLPPAVRNQPAMTTCLAQPALERLQDTPTCCRNAADLSRKCE
jgi:hypothetical protein